MYLKSACELQSFLHNNKTFLVITRIKDRQLRYFNGHAKSSTFHWMTPDYWAEYEAGLEEIFNKYDDGKAFKDDNFKVNPLIHVEVKSVPISKKSMFRLLNMEDKDKENVSLLLECTVEYSDEAEKLAKIIESHEEYQPEGNSNDTYEKYIPAKKQMRTQSKSDKEPYEIIGTSPQKNYTPSPIKKRKNHIVNTAPIENKEENSDDVLSKYIAESTVSVRRSARSPVKPKYLRDSIELPYSTSKKGVNKRKHSDNRNPDGNNNGNKKKLDWKGKIVTSRKELTYIDKKTQKTILYPERENNWIESSTKLDEESSKDDIIKFPTNEELDEQETQYTKELKMNEKISELLDKYLEPPPRAVEFMPLHNLNKEEIICSFIDFQKVFDDILVKLRNKPKISDYNGINHYTVMGLISVDVESEMMTKLSDTYDKKLDSRPRIQIYTNALLPEWIVRLFMKKYSLNRTDAIKQIVAQKKYKQYKDAESDFHDVF